MEKSLTYRKMGKLKKIEVETLNNGYCLKYDGMKAGCGHMYFSPEKLLEGFMCHIGLEMTELLDPDTMQDFIVSAITWKDNEKCVTETKKLTTALNAMTAKRNKLARRLINERKRMIDLVDGVKVIAGKSSPATKKKLNELTKNYEKHVSLTLEELGVNGDEMSEESL